MSLIWISSATSKYVSIKISAIEQQLKVVADFLEILDRMADIGSVIPCHGSSKSVR